MDDHELAIVSGEIETIVMKPESLELLFDGPVWSEEDLSEDSDIELNSCSFDDCCFVISSGEIVAINNEDLIKTPFYLESYFMDNDRFKSRSPYVSNPQRKVVEIDRVTCYECDIVFCNEHRLLEHLMTHIDVHRMGCDICDKDLNLDEKFQLHMMAVTWQSIYYCDFCRKSCAGVVRSKSQLPPPGKTYMCHDCEYQAKQEMMNFQNSAYLYENIINKYVPQKPPQEILSSSLPPPLPPSTLPLQPLMTSSAPPVTEVLQDHKQKPNSEAKHEEREFYSTGNSTSETQDCYVSCKSPPKKKENKKCRRPKPKVQIISESMKQTLKMPTRSHTREKNKMTQDYKCRYCPVAFTEHDVLITHLKEKHKFYKLNYVCKLCGKDFMQQRFYENHASFHQLAKNHMCFVCNLAFLSKYELEQHAKIHDKSEIINTYCDHKLTQENQ